MLSNTAQPKYYSQFRDAVLRHEIPVCQEISWQMNRPQKDDLCDTALESLGEMVDYGFVGDVTAESVDAGFICSLLERGIL